VQKGTLGQQASPPRRNDKIVAGEGSGQGEESNTVRWGFMNPHSRVEVNASEHGEGSTTIRVHDSGLVSGPDGSTKGLGKPFSNKTTEDPPGGPPNSTPKK